MLLREAKEILEKNGYRLDEDAYTDAMDAEDDEVLRNVQIKSKINELVNLLKKTNYFKNNEIEQKMEGSRYVLGGTGEKCYIEARVYWSFDQWRIKFYLKIDDKFVKLYYSNDFDDFIENFDTEWEEVKTDIEHTINYKNRAKTRLGRLTNVFRDKYFDDLEEAKEILKKNGYKLVEDTSEGPKVTDLKDKILNVLKNSAEGLTLKEIAKELQFPFVNARLTYSAGRLVDDGLVTYNEKTNKWTVAGDSETNDDYDVETLVKMWIEQNKPSGENIDYREHDDGSISIFEVIYDPHDCGDDWDQEWDYLADFENIDELKTAVGV